MRNKPVPVPPTTTTTPPVSNAGYPAGGNSKRPGSAFTKGDTGYLGPPTAAGTGTVGSTTPPTPNPALAANNATPAQFRSQVKSRMGVAGTTRQSALTGAAAALGGGTFTGAIQRRLARVNKRTANNAGLAPNQAKRQIRRNKNMGLKAVPNTAPALTKKPEPVY